ncbi:outer membrane lipoprotein-sorting protein [Parachitinimonas caeni]|uniref:Outer membrane lipoprotein-sorting protein n=1 Tax=Parachitinimonas caeni TaxID=3031301 RepID=A0ABT7DVX6_9NEIS|nr:outer membrane lipoprotein-sorting protein [Parachitinimonas caeni]MDK2123263.1 outer membrane lipoprotein-sorting protein [Parachitinimonas caeni]
MTRPRLTIAFIPIMTIRPSLLPLTLLLAATPLTQAANLPVEDILRQVDHYRMPVPSFEASVRITPLRDGKEQEPGTYLIKGGGPNQVLVEATSFDQRGQKFLTTDNGLFFYAPRTKRAIRLTPLQTLRGQASIGDIARISFASDYTASEMELPPQSCPDSPCLALQLTSKNREATYTRIELIVSRQKSRYVPIKAMLHVASGKLLKIAQFTPASGNLPPSTLYLDPQDASEQTRVEFEKLSAATFPPALFNPRSLEQ